MGLFSWFSREDDNAEPTRAELIVARENVKREIEILQSGPVIGRNRDLEVGGLIQRLSATLQELDECIAERGEEAEAPIPPGVRKGADVAAFDKKRGNM